MFPAKNIIHVKRVIDLKIREANESDIPIIIDLIKQLAVYEKLEDIFEATPEMYRRWGWGPDSIFKVLLVESKGVEGPKHVGIALYYFTYSAFTGQPTLWLEDIFVSEKFRGSGIGTALLRHLAKIAVKKDCRRMEWAVLDWNEPSRRFYFGLGAQTMDGWMTFRLTSADINRLAKE